MRQVHGTESFVKRGNSLLTMLSLMCTSNKEEANSNLSVYFCKESCSAETSLVGG